MIRNSDGEIVNNRQYQITNKKEPQYEFGDDFLNKIVADMIQTYESKL